MLIVIGLTILERCSIVKPIILKLFFKGDFYMIIDDKVIQDYLNDRPLEGLKNHWVFHKIEPEKYLFETPDSQKKESVSKVYQQLLHTLNDFTPLNEELFKRLFPNYRALLKELNVLFIVGCPEPYDAIFLEHHDKQYIVFDLIRFSTYIEHGYDVQKLVKGLVTHEFIHFCIAKDYPMPNPITYEEQLSYIIFNEGFAHLLAFNECIEEVDWHSLEYNQYYINAKNTLMMALKEEDPKKQSILLEQADSGAYWDKFGAITGKLYLSKHLIDLGAIYQKGYKDMLNAILE